MTQLTPQALERLIILNEEMAEAQQAISKIIRFGKGRNGIWMANIHVLEKELGDVEHAIHLLAANGDINYDEVMRSARKKAATIKEHCIHSHGWVEI